MNWNDDELKASVLAYVEMRRNQFQGIKVTKKQYYRQLSEQFGRTPGAYERRMQNISHVLAVQGRQWLKGLKPAKHVGTNVIAKLEVLLAEVEGQALGNDAAFATQVENAKPKRSQPPKGDKAPKKVTASVTQYQRDPEVVSWVLSVADGLCECCNQPAPFTKIDGTPFLEVHHVCRLADGGSDTVQNAVALCPNCHRRLHYGADRAELVETLRSSVSRLV